ncbi:S-adenosyl-L-methionine-dependent methyltransferase [Auriscalpium vulgare]|uniref:S-adenosyl-L-methionine-dependent methyltransferase n=1 Tax=Auriscalpium vulgare TaxID=40419 RepID=A0ACB8SBK1_9AGAM|nr:S-adenosyl-L-methionine-dependent methyltransferase [Auriscalpium vulgare]
MGKKSAAMSGIARFWQQAFDPPNGPVADSEPTTSTGDGGADMAEQPARTTTPAHSNKDATSLVPYYTDASQVPEHLQKYFSQRTRYFSLYDSGCLLDEEGWYSVTPEAVADQIAERCRCTTVLDAFCGVGGNAIAFARTCERVIALDTSPTRLALARHNATIYGVADRIEFILADYLAFAATLGASPSPRKIDVVFLSPPWGGPSYLSGSGPTALEEDKSIDSHPEFSLSNILPVHGQKLFNITRAITPNVAYYLPRNTRLQEISALLSTEDFAEDDQPRNRKRKRGPEEGQEQCEIEEEWMGNKLKALTCYFGGLVAGQEHLF